MPPLPIKIIITENAIKSISNARKTKPMKGRFSCVFYFPGGDFTKILYAPDKANLITKEGEILLHTKDIKY